ncbi:MAG: hypothetical protein ABIX01_22130 [Chitinophagaceae bacterium]
MPVNTKYICDFEANAFIHVTSKAVGTNVLFQNDENRKYFLLKYGAYANGYFDTYAYCLLENHTHWLIKCTDEDLLKSHLETLPKDSLKKHQKKYLNGELNFSEAVEFQFKDFFISYAMSFNKMFKRSGSLFISPIKRILLEDDSHLTHLIVYIHANILKHKIGNDFINYRWSSYQAIITNALISVSRNEVLEWFGGRDAFIKSHKGLSAFYYDHPFSLD